MEGKILKYKAVKKRETAKVFLFCFFILLSIYLLLFNLPEFKTSTGFQKSLLSNVIVNSKNINEKSVYEKVLKTFIEYIYKEYFSPKSFLLDTFPSLLEGGVIPKVEIVDNNPVSEMKKDENANVVESQNSSKNLQIKNETSYKVDVQSILSEKPSFKKTFENPMVLIVHTHSSEAYHSNGEYIVSDTDRTQDENYNVIKRENAKMRPLFTFGISGYVQPPSRRQITPFPNLILFLRTLWLGVSFPE